MNTKKPTAEQWRQAYKLAGEIKKMAPWTWMHDCVHIGFMDPKDASPRFISVMGGEGEHIAIAVYRRVEDLFHILDMLSDPDAEAEEILELSQLQLSFEDRDYLQAADRQVIKQLKLSFRGRQAWPCFRSFLPGQFPWHVDSDELRLLCLGLEQVLAVAPRFKDDEDELDRLSDLGIDEQVFLMRTLVTEAGGSQWQESMVEITRPESVEFVAELGEELLERVRGLPVSKNKIEVDLHMLPSPTMDPRSERPFFPYVLLAVEQDRGSVVGCEVIAPLPSLDTVYHESAGLMLDVLLQQDARPQEIHVRSARTASLLRDLCERLDIRLKQRSSLPYWEEAFESLLQYFSEE